MLATDPDFNMFIGDFIYADHPYYAAFDSEFYYRKFRNVIGDPSMTNLLTAVPSVFMFDDHEFDDNWDLGNQDVRQKISIIIIAIIINTWLASLQDCCCCVGIIQRQCKPERDTCRVILLQFYDGSDEFLRDWRA